MKPTALLLHCINPETNAKRFYRLEVGLSLLDEIAVIRQWGRIGGHQRGMVTPCVSEWEALKLIRRLLRRRQRGGYEVEEGTIGDFIREGE